MKLISSLGLAVLSLAAACGGLRADVLISFDRLFQGDDPTEGFTFSLPYAASTPNWLRFDGFVENLAVDETGVRFGLSWEPLPGEPGGSLGFPEGEGYFMGVRLPPADAATGTTRVPLHFGALLDYAPGRAHLTIEGLGPADYFRLVGDLTLQPVPEPEVLVLLGLAAGALWLWRRRQQRAGNSP